jgi:hypothetical protein
MMNWTFLEDNIGYRLQLKPPACRLDSAGEPLPPEQHVWILDHISEESVRISNLHLGHVVTLARAHCHHFKVDPERSRWRTRHGVLTLNVQLFLQGDHVWVRRNRGPGEPTQPQPAEVSDMWVDLEYPRKTGLQERLEASGYQARWARSDRIEHLVQLEGYEIVIEPVIDGRPTRLHVKTRPTPLTLVKRRA